MRKNLFYLLSFYFIISSENKIGDDGASYFLQLIQKFQLTKLTLDLK
jgi:hypothetical protein